MGYLKGFNKKLAELYTLHQKYIKSAKLGRKKKWSKLQNRPKVVAQLRYKTCDECGNEKITSFFVPRGHMYYRGRRSCLQCVSDKLNAISK